MFISLFPTPGLHKLWSAGKRLMRTKRIYEDREIWKEYALLSRNGICREYALFGIVLTQIWLRQMRFDSDFTQTSGQKNGDWSLWSSVAVRLSSVLSPKSSVLGPHSSVTWRCMWARMDRSLSKPTHYWSVLWTNSSRTRTQMEMEDGMCTILIQPASMHKMTLEQWEGWKRRRANLALLMAK